MSDRSDKKVGSSRKGSGDEQAAETGVGRTDEGTGRFAYDGLERLLHEKARLGIMTSLLTHPDGLLFGELKSLCSLTDGNLSRHIQVLNEAGLVEVWKGFERRRPQTLCRLSDVGRERFISYLDILRQVVQDAHPNAAHASAVRQPPPGWVPV